MRACLARLIQALSVAILCATTAAHAQPQGKVLRVASAFDPQTMDPHALALLYHTRLAAQIDEGPVTRDRTFKLEPALATSWSMVDATTWRFQLREGVRFHDGTLFTADDGVDLFSLSKVTVGDRALA